MATIQIADNDARVQYTQAVTANSTTLTIDFPFFSLDDIKVIVTTSSGTDTTLTRGSGTGTFAVNGTAVDDGFSGGNITLGDTYDNTHTYTIFRDITIQRTSDFPTSGPFNISSLNTELDKLTAITQQNNNNFERSIKLTDSDATASLTIPSASDRPNKYLGFDGAGNLAALSGTGATIGTIDTANIANNAINEAKIANNSVTEAKIGTNAVTNAKMADNSVGSDEIIDNSVTAAELNIAGNGSVGQFIVSDGDGSFSYGTTTAPTMQVFTSSGTWTKPTGCKKVKVTVVGGGGGGGACRGNPGTGRSCAGAGGGAAIKFIDVTSISSETVTVGAGGIGGTQFGGGGTTTGGTGGTSSYGSHCSATGGIGGNPADKGFASANGVFGGEGSGGDINIKGTPPKVTNTSNGGTIVGIGGDSIFGGGSTPRIFNVATTAIQVEHSGATLGGGGGGTAQDDGNNGGLPGGSGIVIVEEYY